MFEFHYKEWFAAAWGWAKPIAERLIEELLPSPFFIASCVLGVFYLQCRRITRLLKRSK